MPSAHVVKSKRAGGNYWNCVENAINRGMVRCAYSKLLASEIRAIGNGHIMDC